MLTALRGRGYVDGCFSYVTVQLHYQRYCARKTERTNYEAVQRHVTKVGPQCKKFG